MENITIKEQKELNNFARQELLRLGFEKIENQNPYDFETYSIGKQPFFTCKLEKPEKGRQLYSIFGRYSGKAALKINSKRNLHIFARSKNDIHYYVAGVKMEYKNSLNK